MSAARSGPSTAPGAVPPVEALDTVDRRASATTTPRLQHLRPSAATRKRQASGSATRLCDTPQRPPPTPRCDRPHPNPMEAASASPGPPSEANGAPWGPPP
eukprot:scaffold20981_cov122-Isochrysis_galbana.AAC.5